MAGERLVTLTGAPGVGKTWLAEHALRHLPDLPGFEHIHSASVEGALPAAELVARIAQAAGPLLEPVGRIANAPPRPLQTLVRIDGLVGVPAGLPGLLVGLLDRHPTLGLLVVSRQRLAVPREAHIVVPPLSPDEAAALFLERAARTDARFDERHGDLIRELVDELDCLPVAIERAAQMVRAVSPGELLARLRRASRQLSAGTATRPVHPELFADLFAASWATLDPAEQAILTACTIFEGGFQLEAAERILEDLHPTIDVAGALLSLVDKSLLMPVSLPRLAGERRFRQLRVLKAHARAKAAGHDFKPAFAAHARHYLDVAARWGGALDGPEGNSAAARLALERDNLAAVHERLLLTDPKAACEAALLLAPVLLASGRERERLERLDSAVALAESIPDPALDARARYVRAQARIRAGRIDDALADLRNADAKPLADQTLGVRIKLARGIAYEILDRADLAERCYTQALEAVSALNDRGLEGNVFYSLGTLRSTQHRLAQAEKHFQRALAIFREVGNLRLQSPTLLSLGQIAQARGDYDGAESLFDEALAQSERFEDDMAGSVIRANLAVLLHEAESPRAADAYEAALEGARRVGNRRYEALCLLYRAILTIERQRFREARQRIERAGALLAAQHLERDRILAQAYQGVLDCVTGELERGRKLLARLRINIEELGDTALRQAYGALTTACGGDEGPADPARPAAQPPHSRGEAEILYRAYDVRLARRVAGIIAKALGAARSVPEPSTSATEAPAAEDGPRLVVDPRRARVCLPNFRTVDLARYTTQWRLLEALVQARLAAPGVGQSVPRLFAHVWPDERVLPGTETNRVYVAMTSLRRRGFRELIHTTGDGYLLDPELPLLFGELEDA